MGNGGMWYLSEEEWAWAYRHTYQFSRSHKMSWHLFPSPNFAPGHIVKYNQPGQKISLDAAIKSLQNEDVEMQTSENFQNQNDQDLSKTRKFEVNARKKSTRRLQKLARHFGGMWSQGKGHLTRTNMTRQLFRELLRGGGDTKLGHESGSVQKDQINLNRFSGRTSETDMPQQFIRLGGVKIPLKSRRQQCSKAISNSGLYMDENSICLKCGRIVSTNMREKLYLCPSWQLTNKGSNVCYFVSETFTSPDAVGTDSEQVIQERDFLLIYSEIDPAISVKKVPTFSEYSEATPSMISELNEVCDASQMRRSVSRNISL
uniref:Uncharacterized protein n=1 Tax=Hanusia phi TaxID=3032 RepID=A0A6T7SLW8_9CRYP|mmetsp:Transcript_35059/g.79290  ORF Transcript_35059/g.79290 Transcript_35059/m.79290 type:complete len:317 (+) Transcript_35059:1052-2002(+)